MSKTVGVIGGMGPLATLDLYNWIIKLTPVDKDQDHIPVIINSNPKIPDRTQYILGEGPNPKNDLLKSARQLESMGAQLLAMPCNTAHYFCSDIQKELNSSQLVNMIEETKKYIDKNFTTTKGKPVIGLLATTGTIKTNLYQEHFKGYNFVVPSQTDQELVQDSIYGKRGIKKGYLKEARKTLREVAHLLNQKGARIVILGCTEISVALRNEKNNGVIYVNPVRILAESLVERSRV